MTVRTGLDRLVADQFAPLHNQRVGLVCHQASIDRTCRHIVDLVHQVDRDGRLTLGAVFGPQHGLWGHTQDNMIEWEGYRDPRFGVPVYSLYGMHRKPTPDMLRDLDVLVVDLQDVGAKYYTFIWTLAYCMEAARERGLPVMVLDRPNPIGGDQVEGTYLNVDYRSFVGLYPMAARHGLTVGEIAALLKDRYYPDCPLEIVEMDGWRRAMYFEETGLPWAMPSPNMPTVETAVVYPGKCLLEATNLSEGRGTTRPFEHFGAPWIDAWSLAEGLDRHELPGAVFRPLVFEPTFQKHAGDLCGGCFLHVTDRSAFLPFRTTIALLREVIDRYPGQFRFNPPPYEYEYEKMPMDILVGNDWLRTALLNGAPLDELAPRWEEESSLFEEERQAYLRYA